ncbi:SigE family RNA polymerase sigma factor [Jatrophihabitans fulvus]
MTFDDYVREQRPALLRFATVLSGQVWLAQDIVSDVLDRVYEKWDHIGGLAHPHAYVRRMVVNDYTSWHRRVARTSPRADVDPGAVTDVSSAYAERDAMIRRLENLPPKQRAAVVLRYYAGMADDEIADHLRCRPGTVRSQIARALATLRVQLQEPALHSVSEEA